MSINHEDCHVLAIFSPNMATAVMAINETHSAHLLRQIVHENRGFWLLFKDDSWLKQQWAQRFPSAEVIVFPHK